MADFVLQAENLTKVFRATRSGFRGDAIVAVDDVSFQVPPAGSLGIVGGSGSGKTTTARMIVGLEKPTSGSIQIGGRVRRAGRLSLSDRRRRAREVQIVFQNPYLSLDPRQSVASCLDEILRLHTDLAAPARADRTLQLLTQVELGERELHMVPRQLSGGQRQRVAIARALAALPQVLILDEAVASLDVSIQAQILNLLADVRAATNVAYVFVSHDFAAVRQLCEETIVMQGGRIVESGPTERIVEDPQHEYTRALIDAIPRPGWRPHRTASRSAPDTQPPVAAC